MRPGARGRIPVSEQRRLAEQARAALEARRSAAGGLSLAAARRARSEAAERAAAAYAMAGFSRRVTRLDYHSMLMGYRSSADVTRLPAELSAVLRELIPRLPELPGSFTVGDTLGWLDVVCPTQTSDRSPPMPEKWWLDSPWPALGPPVPLLDPNRPLAGVCVRKACFEPLQQAMERLRGTACGIRQRCRNCSTHGWLLLVCAIWRIVLESTVEVLLSVRGGRYMGDRVWIFVGAKHDHSFGVGARRTLCGRFRGPHSRLPKCRLVRGQVAARKPSVFSATFRWAPAMAVPVGHDGDWRMLPLSELAVFGQCQADLEADLRRAAAGDLASLLRFAMTRRVLMFQQTASRYWLYHFLMATRVGGDPLVGRLRELEQAAELDPDDDSLRCELAVRRGLLARSR